MVFVITWPTYSVTMLTVPVQVAGDVWYNRDQVVDLLAAANGQLIQLDMGAEGASLNRLGITKAVLDTGIDPKSVTVINWSNSVEYTPFCLELHHHRASHFFWHHQLHTVRLPPSDVPPTALFGLFVGRRSPARCKILYDVYNTYPDSCTSLMRTEHTRSWRNTSVVSAETVNDWVVDSEMDSFTAWWQNPPVVSIDDCSISDQYSGECDTNRNLLLHYYKFAMEIVCETYCYGNTFFPTEKTVRPIAAGKPFVLFGPVDFLKRLRDYGFRTFGEFWDESYDQLEGAERWAEMQQVLAHIRDQYSKDNKFVAKLNNITAYNRKILQQVVEKYQPT